MDMLFVRKMIIISGLLYCTFIILDYFVAYEYLLLFFYIRFLMVLPLFIISYVFSYTKRFQSYYYLLLSVSLFACGVGCSLMIVLQPENISYYGGMFLIIFAGFFFTRLPFFFASSCTIGMLIFHIVFFLQRWGEFDSQSTYILFFLFIAILIGMIGNWINNKYFIINYVHDRTASSEKIILERKLYNRILEVSELHKTSISTIATLCEARDSHTGDHIQRISKYCEDISRNIPIVKIREQNMSEIDFIEIISISCMLHDIGKISIPDSILMKPGALTEDEFKIMQQHTVIGSETLKKISKTSIDNPYVIMGIDIAKSHHEWWDGNGYPDNLKGEEIPLCARIVCISDVYDALISERPYKKPYSHKKSLDIILAHKGTQFDPYIVDIFMSLYS